MIATANLIEVDAQSTVFQLRIANFIEPFSVVEPI